MFFYKNMVLFIENHFKKEIRMSLTKSWYTVDEAASKFGVSTKDLLHWAELGIVRTEEVKGSGFLLNGDDIEMKLNLIPSV